MMCYLQTKTRTWWALCLCLTFLIGGRSVRSQTIELTVTVNDPAGQPIPQAPIESMSLVESRFLMTDESGQAIFSIDKQTSETTITVRMTDGGLVPLVPKELRVVASARFHALRKQYAFKPLYIVPLEGGGTAFAATITARDAITVAGRVVDSNANARESVVGCRGSAAFDFVFDFEQGNFTLGGVPKNAPAELWVAGAESQIHQVELTAQQTAENINIGDIVVQDTLNDAAVTIQLQNAGGLHLGDKVSLRYDLGLIAADDAESHMLEVQESGQAYLMADDGIADLSPAMPSGTYYVTPGSFGSRSFFALYEAVKAGRQALLDAAGVPKITIVVGQVTDFTFDAQAALDAVIEVGGDLAPE